NKQMMPSETVLVASGLMHFHRTEKLMGNRFAFSLLTDSQAHAESCFDAAVQEIRRIEKLLTTFSDSSETNQINALAGIRPFVPSPEVYELTRRAQRISDLTQGAFDITYGGVDKSLWNFDTR